MPMDSSKKKKRQEAILQAALKLFTKKGYFNTSVNDIQNACKMSVGTLSLYFDNKESIAITLYSNLENCLYEALCEIEHKHENAHDRYQAALRHFFKKKTEKTPNVMQYLLYSFT